MKKKNKQLKKLNATLRNLESLLTVSLDIQKLTLIENRRILGGITHMNNETLDKINNNLGKVLTDQWLLAKYQLTVLEREGKITLTRSETADDISASMFILNPEEVTNACSEKENCGVESPEESHINNGSPEGTEHSSSEEAGPIDSTDELSPIHDSTVWSEGSGEDNSRVNVP